MTWKSLEDAQPELARFGAERLNDKVAYLATVRKDGSPRVHPMTPIIEQGHLFVFMEPASPKGKDLQRDGRYAIHCSVTDTSGESGEFIITGHAHLVEDAELRALAVRSAGYSPAERYILFEFDVENASSTTYPADAPMRQFWKRDDL
jgi:pyridoxamine 5'-phosphate oxidase-like protein